MPAVLRSSLAAAAIALGVVALPASAHAAGSEESSPRRAVPDYDGRPAPITAGEVLLWVPRVVAFPLYVTTDLVIRRPVGWLIGAADHRRGLDNFTKLFTFGPREHAGIVPTVQLDLGMRSRAGVYVFHDDFLAPGNQLRLHTLVGGLKDWSVALADRVPIDPGSYVKLRAEADRRSDALFYGLGSRSLESSRARYGAQSVEGSATVHLALGPGASAEAWAGATAIRFAAATTCCHEDALATRGDLALPPGIEGYVALRQGLRLTLDSRLPRPAPGGGFRFEADAQHSVDLRDPGASRWLTTGVSAAATVDLTGHGRLLTVTLATRFADPLADAGVPFTELASLGGDQGMSGYRANRLLGRSAVTGTFEYRYPILASLDGSLHAGIGNVFGAHLEGFEARLLRLSFDLGIDAPGPRDHALKALVGFGTETFADGTHPSSIRLAFGGTTGF
ncbi:MAG: hypothetical protein ABJE95_03020 [Byssovorax sp.]